MSNLQNEDVTPIPPTNLPPSSPPKQRVSSSISNPKPSYHPPMNPKTPLSRIDASKIRKVLKI